MEFCFSEQAKNVGKYCPMCTVCTVTDGPGWAGWGGGLVVLITGTSCDSRPLIYKQKPNPSMKD